MRKGERSDWTEFSERQKRQHRVAQKALMRGMDALTDEERAVMLPDKKPRARPRQHEGAEMYALATAIMHDLRPWWAPGFQRWEARTAQHHETMHNWREGAQPGWPDCGLFVPALRSPVRAVVEMKRPDLKPRREMPIPMWWLQEWPTNVSGRPQSTWYGLDFEQHRWLRILHGCGFETLVAYYWREAYEWLDDLAGPRPEVMPW